MFNMHSINRFLAIIQFRPKYDSVVYEQLALVVKITLKHGGRGGEREKCVSGCVCDAHTDVQMP